MKLASFRFNGVDRIGAVLDDGTMIDLADAIKAAGGQGAGATYHDMIALIEAGPQALAAARAAVEKAAANPAVARISPESVIWHPPVRRPSKLCCLALNNSANADRIMSGPKHPAIFILASNALVGHGQAIEVRPEHGRVHPEPELAVIIGKTAKEVAAAQAFDHIFGYTIHNDITSPTMRQEDTFHYRAIHPGKSGSDEIAYVDSYTTYQGRYKGTDTFSPLGPWIVTRDEIPDPHALNVICRHKDKLITEDNTQNLFHKVPEVIAFITRNITLLPGDVVSMGTALKRASSGGGAVQNVDLAKFGGPISVTIEKIGTLSNTVANR